MTDQHHEAGRRREAAEAFDAAAARMHGSPHDRVHDTGTRIVHGTGSATAGARGTGTTSHQP